jgi:hypothetical protein
LNWLLRVAIDPLIQTERPLLQAHVSTPYFWSGYKVFVVGDYTKARFVLHIKAPDSYNQQSVEINIDGVAKKQRDVHLPADTWCRLAYNMPVNKTTLVGVHR